MANKSGRLVNRIELSNLDKSDPWGIATKHGWDCNVCHVSMLQKIVTDPYVVMETPKLEISDELTSKVRLVAILDRDVQTRCFTMELVNVQWSEDPQYATWEMELTDK